MTPKQIKRTFNQMTKIKFIAFVLITLLFVRCQEQVNTATVKSKTEPEKTESINEIKGLTQLSKQWTRANSHYWKRDKDSVLQSLQPSDTLSTSGYIISENYQRRLSKDLTIRKMIDIDSKTKNKISETDSYTKRLNPNIEAQLDLKYNFKTGKYYATYLDYAVDLDSSGISEKMLANRQKADSALKKAKRIGVELCGTAYNQILWEGIPFLPIPRNIDKDSALLIINEWTKE